MDEIFLGAFATEQDAIDAMSVRPEPLAELSVVNDGFDAEHPWRIAWFRS